MSAVVMQFPTFPNSRYYDRRIICPVEMILHKPQVELQ
jgi:hypothetical protein